MSYREPRESTRQSAPTAVKNVKFKPEHSRPVTGEIVGQKDARYLYVIASTLLLCVDFVEQYIKFRENI